MTKLRDLTNQRFERLLIKQRVEDYVTSSGKKYTQWLCVCDCGNIVKQTTNHLTRKSKPVKSCGCLNRELAAIRGKKQLSKHEMHASKEYKAWQNMKDRCNNPNAANYKSYGARGITVCDAWNNSFEAFYQDVGPSPLNGILDRIDNDGNYEPGNVRWTDAKTSSNNRRHGNRYKTNY